MCGKDIFEVEEPPILDSHNFHVIYWNLMIQKLTRTPKIKLQIILDSVTNQILIMTPLSFDILSVHSWAYLS